MKQIIVTDSTLRDGNHAVNHSLNLEQIKNYCLFADEANIPVVEVGHGNGLGASSLLIGKAKHSDEELLTTARKNLKKTKLGIHIIPGIATINKDIKRAIDIGVDVYRVATHCTESTLSKSHIEFLKNNNKTVFGVLMMSALADIKTLLQNAKNMESYGAEVIIIMDSTGTYLPIDVEERIKVLKENLNVEIGFHAHDNLGLATANSLIAAQSGAMYIDACIRGFGAGAGNAHLEMIIPVLEKSGYKIDIDFKRVIQEADKVMDYLIQTAPISTPVNILTGLNRLFSGFEKPIIKASKLYGIEYSSLIFELGNRKLVAGQEDLILEVAEKIKNENINNG
jgi:4-hydroxy 2-oxovalerate aldolase